MLPTIIYLLIKKYRRTHPESAKKIQEIMLKAGKIIIILVLFLAVAHIAISQEKKLEYVIKRKGSEVGAISIIQQTLGNRMFIKLESEVRTRMIFLFTAKGKEESIYENGILTWSSIYRKMNGSEKANKKTRLSGKNYIVSKGDDSETLNSYPIRYNMLCLYILEPVNIQKVYSDNFQQFLDIQTLAPHHYKIRFPDGNSSEYFFSNGICSTIKVHHSLYSATIELKP